MSVERVGYILLLDLLAGTGEGYSTALNYLIVPPDTGHSATALAALIVFGWIYATPFTGKQNICGYSSSNYTII